MIIDSLRATFDKNRDKNPLFLRNILKEQLQYYVLNFIYNSSYGEKFLFKGGTCLRFALDDFPRLSEDLDFDVEDFAKFDFQNFTQAIYEYFSQKLSYKDLEIKVSGKNKIIYLKFPLLDKINFAYDKSKPSERILFLRIDLAPIKGSGFTKEISLKSTYDFSFIIKRYSLPDIAAGKLSAILTRERWEGEKKEARFKGRDYFDIFWLSEKKIFPNLIYLKSILPSSFQKNIFSLVKEKLKEASRKKQDLKKDLLSFFAENQFVERFVDNFDLFVEKYLKYLKNEKNC
ncbi:MAG: nucleotidyl transferase AbiEii/AbiGii toxin family protein [Microgenomates group bacterium]